MVRWSSELWERFSVKAERNEETLCWNLNSMDLLNSIHSDICPVDQKCTDFHKKTRRKSQTALAKTFHVNPRGSRSVNSNTQNPGRHESSAEA